MYKPAHIYKEQEAIRDCLLSVLQEGLRTLPEDIKALNPTERIKVLLDVAEFVLPKIGRSDNSSAYKYTIHTEYEEEDQLPRKKAPVINTPKRHGIKIHP
jgi:hypothetical protein